MTRGASKRLIAGQALLAGLGLAGLALWPPAAGAMMLVPLSGDANAAAAAGLAASAALLGPGPLPGSIVVTADRGRIAAFRNRILVTAAPPAACGDILDRLPK